MGTCQFCNAAPAAYTIRPDDPYVTPEHVRCGPCSELGEYSGERVPLITESEIRTVHQVGIGRQSPGSQKARARFEKLHGAGLLGRNAETGLYFITDAGHRIVTES